MGREITKTSTRDQGHRRLLQNLAWLRLLSAAAQVFATLVAAGMNVPFPAIGVLIGAAFLVCLSALTFLRLQRAWPVMEIEVFIQFFLDVTELTFVLFLTGGSANPFVTLLIVPITLAATALPRLHIIALTVISCAAYFFLMTWNRPFAPLHQHADSGFGAHLYGMAITFVFSAVLLAFFITRLAEAVRRQSAAIQRERDRAIRDEGILAVAIQAAGAAHELNTPLSTMLTLLTEMRRDQPVDSAGGDDLDVLQQQAQRCKDILRAMVRTGTQSLQDRTRSVALTDFVAKSVDEFCLLRPSADVNVDMSAGTENTIIRVADDLRHSIISLLNNGWEASKSNGSDRVDLNARIDDAAHIVLTVRDYGPGLSIADGLGARFATDKQDGLGLGLALASATAERYGGALTADVVPNSGTTTRLSVAIT